MDLGSVEAAARVCMRSHIFSQPGNLKFTLAPVIAAGLAMDEPMAAV